VSGLTLEDDQKKFLDTASKVALSPVMGVAVGKNLTVKYPNHKEKHEILSN